MAGNPFPGAEIRNALRVALNWAVREQEAHRQRQGVSAEWILEMEEPFRSALTAANNID